MLCFVRFLIDNPHIFTEQCEVDNWGSKRIQYLLFVCGNLLIHEGNETLMINESNLLKS